jgi:hypothetical protein
MSRQINTPRVNSPRDAIFVLTIVQLIELTSIILDKRNIFPVCLFGVIHLANFILIDIEINIFLISQDVVLRNINIYRLPLNNSHLSTTADQSPARLILITILIEN